MKVKNLKLNVDRVMNVYSGRPGCMCGCRGNYRVASAHVAIASKDRGYGYEPKEISDRQVRRIVKLIESQPEVELDEQYAYVEVDGRAYCAYFVPAPKSPVMNVIDHGDTLTVIFDDGTSYRYDMAKVG